MFAIVRNRSQPLAIVGNRSREVAMAMPMVSSAKGVISGCFQGCVASFCVAGVALRHIPTCFMTCQKSVCVARTILCMAGAELSTCQAQCFLANRIVRAARSGDMVEIQCKISCSGKS